MRYSVVYYKEYQKSRLKTLRGNIWDIC